MFRLRETEWTVYGNSVLSWQLFCWSKIIPKEKGREKPAGSLTWERHQVEVTGCWPLWSDGRMWMSLVCLEKTGYMNWTCKRRQVFWVYQHENSPIGGWQGKRVFLGQTFWISSAGIGSQGLPWQRYPLSWTVRADKQKAAQITGSNGRRDPRSPVGTWAARSTVLPQDGGAWMLPTPDLPLNWRTETISL